MINFILKYRIPFLIVIILLTLGISFFILNLQRDASITAVLPADDPDFEYNQYIEGIFGSTEEIILMVRSEQSVYSPPVLTFLYNASKKISSINGIDTELISSILSIGTQGSEVGLPITETDSQRIQSRVEGNPISAGRLVSEDFTSTLMAIPIPAEISYSDKELNQLLTELKQSIESIRPDAIQVFYSGHPVVKADITRYMSNDLYRLFPVALLTVMLIIGIMLRSFRGTLIPILVTLLSVAWTFGLKGLLGSPLTLTETVIPVALISIACAGAIHIVSSVLIHIDQGMEGEKAIKQAMKELTLPVILTSLTTAIGFASLIWAPGQSLKNMGLALAFGVTMAMLFSLTMVPIILSFYHKQIPRELKRGKDRFHFLSGIHHVVQALLRHKIASFILILLLLGSAVPGVLNINTDTDEVRYFIKNAPVRIATEEIENHMGGISILYLVLTSDEPDRFRDVETIQFVEQLQEFGDSLDNVSYTTSMADLIKSVNFSAHGENLNYYEVPDNPILTRRFISMLEKRKDSAKALQSHVTEDYAMTNIHIRMKNSNTAELQSSVDLLNTFLNQNLPEGLTYRYAGDYVRIKNGQIIITSQINSLLAALVMILVCLSLIFRSPLIGVLISVPVGIAILLNFTIMWLFGVSLNPATSIIASVGMGVGIDYAIHYFSRFKHIYLEKGDYHGSLIEAAVQSARGIISNAAAVGTGFLVLLFSSYTIIRDMGWIIALSMFTTAGGALTILPVLLWIFKPKIKRSGPEEVSSL